MSLSKIDMHGVHDTLGFHGIPHDVRKTVRGMIKEHGHLGREGVMDNLRGLSGDRALSDHHLRRIQEAIEKHTSREEEV